MIGDHTWAHGDLTSVCVSLAESEPHLIRDLQFSQEQIEDAMYRMEGTYPR